jgi:hypothetical protein
MNLFKKSMSVFILAATILFGSVLTFADERQETDNKIREMANETYFMETDNKVREMANETSYTEEERFKTSDKHHRLVEDDSFWYQIIFEFIGL